jgi:hypothetical protein
MQSLEALLLIGAGSACTFIGGVLIWASVAWGDPINIATVLIWGVAAVFILGGIKAVWVGLKVAK